MRGIDLDGEELTLRLSCSDQSKFDDLKLTRRWPVAYVPGMARSYISDNNYRRVGDAIAPHNRDGGGDGLLDIVFAALFALGGLIGAGSAYHDFANGLTKHFDWGRVFLGAFALPAAFLLLLSYLFILGMVLGAGVAIYETTRDISQVIADRLRSPYTRPRTLAAGVGFAVVTTGIVFLAMLPAESWTGASGYVRACLATFVGAGVYALVQPVRRSSTSAEDSGWMSVVLIFRTLIIGPDHFLSP